MTMLDVLIQHYRNNGLMAMALTDSLVVWSLETEYDLLSKVVSLAANWSDVPMTFSWFQGTENEGQPTVLITLG